MSPEERSRGLRVQEERIQEEMVQEDSASVKLLRLFPRQIRKSHLKGEIKDLFNLKHHFVPS